MYMNLEFQIMPDYIMLLIFLRPNYKIKKMKKAVNLLRWQEWIRLHHTRLFWGLSTENRNLFLKVRLSTEKLKILVLPYCANLLYTQWNLETAFFWNVRLNHITFF